MNKETKCKKRVDSLYSMDNLSDLIVMNKYKKLLNMIGECIYDLSSTEKTKLLKRVYENSIKFYDDELIMKSMLVLSSHCDSQNLLNFIIKIYEKSDRCRWVIPLGLSYIDQGELTMAELSEAKRIARDLLNSSDPKVIEELQFFEELFEIMS